MDELWTTLSNFNWTWLVGFVGLIIAVAGFRRVTKRLVRVRVHRAFLDNGSEGYFVSVSNVSPLREVEITHVWFRVSPEVHVLRPERPLPKRLKTDEAWETWVDVREMPEGLSNEQVYALARVQLSSGQVFVSRQNRRVPKAGFVPGGTPPPAPSVTYFAPSSITQTESLKSVENASVVNQQLAVDSAPQRKGIVLAPKRLKFGQLGGSVNVASGTAYQAHRISVANTEGGYPNCCENVRAEIALTFLYTGEIRRMAGLFARTNGQKITSEPSPSITLPMLESCELLLFCRDSINNVFRTLTRWPFDPSGETCLEFGDWRVEISFSSDSQQDLEQIAYDLSLRPDLSSAWSPLKPMSPSSSKGPAAVSAPRAFISHSTQDHAFVEKFAGDLRTKGGVDAWYSGWEIKPGDSIRKKIDEGLEGCEFFVIVLSKSSISRPWVQTELDAATVGKLNGEVRKIIPIKIEDCGDIPPTLSSLLWEDFSIRPYDAALERVLNSIFDVDVKPPLGRRATSENASAQVAPSPIQFPIDIFRVDELARQLQRDGFDARGNLFNGQVGVIVGPKGLDAVRLPSGTSGLFFPLWELNHKTNRPLVDARRFHDVFEKRPSDWQFNRPYQEDQRHSDVTPLQTPIAADLQVRLIGSHEIDLIVENFRSDQGKHGLLARVHNRRITNLSNCPVLIRDVRSFDLAKGLLRDGSGFQVVRILRENCAAGFESRNAWLLRIEGDHLEIGNTMGGGTLLWPSGDKSETQRWRLFFSVSEGSDEWSPQIDIQWDRGTDTIRLRPVQSVAQS